MNIIKPMLRKRNNFLATFFFILLITISLTSCHKNEGIVSDINPLENSFSNHEMELKNFKAETIISDSIATDEFNCAYNYFGAYQHPKFGLLKSSFAAQFGIYNNNIDISEIKTQSITSFDSVSLSLAYANNNYGSFLGSDTVKNVQIYMLSNPIIGTTSYFNNTDMFPFIASGNMIFDASIGINPNNSVLKINLPTSFFNYLLLPDNLDNLTTDNVKGVFKGLYFKFKDNEPSTGLGNIFSVDLRNVSSKIELGYTSNTGKKVITMTVGADCRRFNIYNSNIKSKITDLNTDTENIYIQGFASSSAKIYCNPYSLLKDSFPIAIVKANLEFEVNNDLLGIDAYFPYISKLKLWYIDENDNVTYLRDELVNNEFAVGGTISSNKNYSFNISQTLQYLLNNKISIKCFLITCDNRNNIPRSVILKTGNNIKLKIKYTKF